ncbi:MAG: hypothetical protein AAF458_10235 [Pseudomonadota bacterium]
MRRAIAHVAAVVLLGCLTSAAHAGVIRSADFEDIATTGDGAVPNAPGSDLWLTFGNVGGGSIYNGSANDGSNNFGLIDVNSNDPWHAGQLLLFLGPLPTLDLSQLELTADIRTNAENAGRRAEFRIESLVASNDVNEPWTRTGYVEFNPLLDATFTNVGGFLDAAPLGANFNAAADAFQIVFAFNDIGFNGALANTGFGSGANNQLYFDNLRFSGPNVAASTTTAVPEPANAALALSGLLLAAASRRRKLRG